jgi:hypothetical protein
MNLKIWWQDIGKGYRRAIGASLAALTLTGLATLAKWGRFHLWLEKEGFTLRLSLSFLILGLLGLDGWIRFWQVQKAKRAVDAQLAAVANPPKLQDNYTFLKDRGFWVHKTTGVRVCGNCLLKSPGVESPLAAIHTWKSYGPFVSNRRKVSVWKCGRHGCHQTYARKEDEV